MWRCLRPFVELRPDVARSIRYWREELRFTRQVPVRTPFGFSFVGRTDMQQGEFEKSEVAVVREIIQKVDIVVDVGAHQGYFTCLAGVASRPVVAVEPLYENLRYLYANIEMNHFRTVEVWPVALGSEPGIGNLYGGGTGASLISCWGHSSKSFCRPVAISTLDTVLCQRFVGARIFIKVDVEGVEYPVLRGASRCLVREPRPIWLVEISTGEHDPTEQNAHWVSTFRAFLNQGYKASIAGISGQELTLSDIRDMTQFRQRFPGVQNFLFC